MKDRNPGRGAPQLGKQSEPQGWSRRKLLTTAGLVLGAGAAAGIADKLDVFSGGSEPKPGPTASGNKSAPASAEPTPTGTETEPKKHTMVTIEHSQFKRDGKRFIPFGTNCYPLMVTQADSDIIGPQLTEAQRKGYIEDISSLKNPEDPTKSAAMDIVRFWASPSLNSKVDKEGRVKRDWSTFDDILVQSAKNDVVVYPALEDYWGSTSVPHARKPDSWFDKTNKKDGYAAPGGYKDYVRELVTKYKGDPRIFALQLMNEAQLKDQSSNPELLLDFTKNMVQLIKSIDKDRLVSLGTIGSGQAGTDGDNYTKLMQEVDFVDIHYYEGNGVDRKWQQDAQVAADLHKPIIVGELGVKTGISQASEFLKQISKLHNFGGVLLWEYEDKFYNRPPESDDGFQQTKDSGFFDVFLRKLPQIKHTSSN